MNWLTWFNTLPLPIQEVLTGATGDLAGGLVGGALSALLGKASGRAQRYFAPNPKHEALQRALARAMVEALTALIDDPLVLRELLGHFGHWLERPAVALELTQVIEPDPDVEIDLEVLEAEFEAAGFAPELLVKQIDFADVVVRFVRSFYNAACQEPELIPPIKLQLLRGMAERLETLVQSAADQKKLLEDIRGILAGFQPLSLEPLERNYLNGLYAECNDLRLIRDARSQPGRSAGPRLQRVYVEVRTTQLPDIDLVFDRLGIAAGQRTRSQSALTRSLGEIELDDAIERGPGERGGRASRANLVERLRSLDDKQLKPLAEALARTPEMLVAALAPLTPLEALRQRTQIVIVGDPGSGKSMLTQRLAGLLAAAGSEDRDQLGDLSEQERRDLQELLAQLGRRLLPIRITLSRWERRSTRPPCADDLIDECVASFGETADLSDGGFKKNFVLKRLSGEAPTALILLDGLDEVTDDARRAWQLAVVEHFHQRFGRVPLLVTCRVRPYQAWQREDKGLSLAAFSLDGLSDAAVRLFAERWYGELLAAGVYEEPEQAQQARLRLLDAIFNAARPNHAELRKMAATPLLLTMMAHVNYTRRK